MCNQNTSVVLVLCGTCRLVGRERLVVILNLGLKPNTSAGARRGSATVCRRGAQPWHVPNQGCKEVGGVGIVLGVGDDLALHPQGLLTAQHNLGDPDLLLVKERRGVPPRRSSPPCRALC